MMIRQGSLKKEKRLKTFTLQEQRDRLTGVNFRVFSLMTILEFHVLDVN